MWYKFSAYNSQTLYGWTTTPEIADVACDRLNRGKEINLYAYEELSDSDDEADGGETPLKDWGGLLFDDDTTLADYEQDD